MVRWLYSVRRKLLIFGVLTYLCTMALLVRRGFESSWDTYLLASVYVLCLGTWWVVKDAKIPDKEDKSDV